jgi:hypothetical protein
MSQVTSVNELRDVEPTAWAYEALRSLVEKYGCIVGYPDQTFRGNRALTRWEFAAGLNACMNKMEELIQQNVAILKEDIDKLKLLAEQFQQELIALGARVDNLEARVSFLEDHQFSTTTKLKGEVVFAVGNAWGGRFTAVDSRGNPAPTQFGNNTFFASRTRLNLDTSFTGNDRLRVRLQGNTTPDLDGATGIETARLAFDSGTSNNFTVNDLYYRFKLGKQFTAWVGANSLDTRTFLYQFNPFMQSSGSGALSREQRFNPFAYRPVGGTGFAGTYKFSKQFLLSAWYLAGDANDPTPGNGLFNGSFSTGTQLQYNPTKNVQLGFNFNHNYVGFDDTVIGGSTGSTITEDPFNEAPHTFNSYNLMANWRISPRFNFSAWGGYGDGTGQGLDQFGVDRTGDDSDSWTWNAALSIVDLGKKGGVLTFSGGQVPRTPFTENDIPDLNASYIVETQYKYPVNKNILFTPGFFVVFNPNHNNENPTLWVGLLRTTFKF